MTLLLLLGGAGETIVDPGDEDTPGVLVEAAFGYTWQDTSLVWTDITPYVAFGQAPIMIRRGRDDELQPFGVGTCSMVLDNRDRRFDPEHPAPSNPYQSFSRNNLVPLTPIRVRPAYDGVLYTLFTGFIEGWPQTYQIGNREAWTSIVANDAFELLSSGDLVSNFWEIEHPTRGFIDADNRIAGEGGTIAEELYGDRIDRILDLAGWPALFRTVDIGLSTLNSTQPTGSPLAALQAAEAAEAGFVFVAVNGNVVARDRHYLQGQTSQATFTDADFSMPYEGLEFSFDRRYIYNDIRREREGGITQSAEDADSIGDYFRRPHELTGLPLTTDAAAKSLADLFLRSYKDPALRPEPLIVDPGNNPATLYPQVLGRELLDRITLERTPQDVGSQISKELVIQGINHEITVAGGRARVRTTWNLAPADVTTWWTVEHATLGTIDSGNLISA